MAKSKLVEVNEKIAEGVVSGYKKIEEGVVQGYQKMEDGVVGSFTKVTDKFVESFLTKDVESIEEAKLRMTEAQDAREAAKKAAEEKHAAHPNYKHESK
ncbi:hypothetical protein [Clostridium transplantifaecale]|uniref:hypothetical protein n=1 Tax=Clostridium transplantifaecale TaxID=2479838 RepID=UPI000F6319F7|nr:hypothetical protein [Clostridium transplantifaecale]